MTRKICSIFQHDGGWCALRLNLQGKRITEVETFVADDFNELNNIVGDYPIGISFRDQSGYLTYLKFPFSGKRKIEMVIRDELNDYFPFPLDDVYFDFQEIGKGNVLVAAVARSVIKQYSYDSKVKVITINSVAALYAFRWFGIIAVKDFLFANVEQEMASIMTFRDGQLSKVRQIVFSGQIEIFKKSLEEAANDGTFRTQICYMNIQDKDAGIVNSLTMSGFDMSIEAPSLGDYLDGKNYLSNHWPGIGAALLSAHHRDEINMLGERSQGFFPVEKNILYIGTCISIVGLIIAFMSYINLFFKERTFHALNFEQMNVFRTVFPKSPPVKDVVKAFEDRVSSIEKDLIGSPQISGISPLQMLSDVSQKIDKQIDVKLSEFSIEGNEFIFAGTTVSFASAEKIKKLIEEVSGVKSVEIQNIDLTANQVKFRLRGKF